MKNKVTLAISTLVLCGSVSVAEAAKHHSISKHSKHTASAHKTKHHSKHSHHIASHSQPFFDFASIDDSHSGTASLYSTRFQGRRTASGERYDMFEMTAAHRTLPLRSYAEITNVNNNRSIIVRINDRGPFHGRRVLDLSTAAAEELGIRGTGSVKITPLAMN